MTFLLLPFVYAEDFHTRLEKARKALQEDQFDKTASFLHKLESKAPALKEIIPPKDLADIWFMRSILMYQKDQLPLEEWRQTLRLDPSYPFDRACIDDPSLYDVYLALTSEIAYQERVPSNIPQNRGNVKIFVNGTEKNHKDKFITGKHFVQVQCNEDTIKSFWSEIPSKQNWIHKCKKSERTGNTPYNEFSIPMTLEAAYPSLCSHVITVSKTSSPSNPEKEQKERTEKAQKQWNFVEGFANTEPYLARNIVESYINRYGDIDIEEIDKARALLETLPSEKERKQKYEEAKKSPYRFDVQYGLPIVDAQGSILLLDGMEYTFSLHKHLGFLWLGLGTSIRDFGRTFLMPEVSIQLEHIFYPFFFRAGIDIHLGLVFTESNMYTEGTTIYDSFYLSPQGSIGYAHKDHFEIALQFESNIVLELENYTTLGLRFGRRF